MITTDQPEQKQFQLKWKSIAIVCMMLCVSVLGTAWVVGSGTGTGGNSIPVVIESGSGVETASYIIYKDGDYTCAKNGTTGRIAYRLDNTTTLLNTVIAELDSGIIFFKAGDYEFEGNVILKSNVQIAGEGAGATNFYYTPTTGDFLSSDQILLTDATALAVNAAIGAVSITVADASDLEEGMYVKIVSNRTIAGLNRGELNQIRTISGNVLTLVRAIDDNYYTTDPTAVRGIGFTENVSISSLSITGPGTETDTTLINGTNLYNFKIDGCTISEGGNTALRFIDCYAAWVDNCVFENVFYTGLGYSVSIVDCSESMKITDNIFRYYGRHYIATGTYTTTTEYPGGMYRDLYISGNNFESSQTGNEAINNHECSYGSMIITGNTFKYNGIGIEPRNAYAIISDNYFFKSEVGINCLNSIESRQVIISNNIFNKHDGTSKAIYIVTSNVSVTSNTFTASRITLLSGANNTVMSNNLFEELPTATAIDALGTSSFYIYNVKIDGNVFKNCGSTSSYYSLKLLYVKYLTFQTNQLSTSSRTMFQYDDYILINGNYISQAVHHGIEVDKSKNVTITNNVIQDPSGTRGISLTGALVAATPVFVSGNTILGVTTKFYNDASYTNVRVTGNSGYVTEASGVATILNGQSYVTVTHGLSATPTKVIVTSGTGGTYTLYVTTLGTTTFRIYADSAVSGNQTVYWYAVV